MTDFPHIIRQKSLKKTHLDYRRASQVQTFNTFIPFVKNTVSVVILSLLMKPVFMETYKHWT